MEQNIPEYDYHDADPTWSCSYLWPVVKSLVESQSFAERRAFDVGCGNGSTCKLLADLGFKVIGVDPSASGISLARQNFPDLEFNEGSAYDDLRAKYGRFPLVVSLEVVEHCYDPFAYARTVFDLVENGGTMILSTPYHGYLKNLALAVAGKWENHLGPLWQGGHIKFFSAKTIRALLEGAGFRDLQIIRVGRIPPLAKSMVVLARK